MSAQQVLGLAETEAIAPCVPGGQDHSSESIVGDGGLPTTEVDGVVDDQHWPSLGCGVQFAEGRESPSFECGAIHREAIWSR